MKRNRSLLLLLTLSLCLSLLILPVKAASAYVVEDEAVLYAMDDWALEHLSIPAAYAQSFQIQVKNAKNVRYSVLSRESATGAGKTYQWQYKAPNGTWKNTTATGAKTATLSVSVTAAKNGYQYRCIVKDNVGNSVTSNAAKLTVK